MNSDQEAIVNSLLALYEEGGIQAVTQATVPDEATEVQESVIERLKESEKRRWAEALEYDSQEFQETSYYAVRSLVEIERPDLVKEHLICDDR